MKYNNIIVIIFNPAYFKCFTISLKHYFIFELSESNKLKQSTRTTNFPYPTQHFQTVPSANQLISGEIQVALPVTALVFSQTSSLPSNLLPLNVQHQQLPVPTMPSPSMLNLSSLERQT
jgi:hypothetical protein